MEVAQCPAAQAEPEQVEKKSDLFLECGGKVTLVLPARQNGREAVHIQRTGYKVHHPVVCWRQQAGDDWDISRIL